MRFAHVERERDSTMTTKREKTAALYLRVSTDGQSVENQRQELEQAAERHGWRVVATFADPGISGAKGRTQRPGLDKLLKGVARREFDMVAVWSVDRLGRSLRDLLDTLGEIEAKKVDLYLHQQGIDTSTPGGRALFQMMGVFAEFERNMIRDRVMAGLARARKAGRIGGRPKLAAEKERRVRDSLAAGAGIEKTAREVGVGVSTVQRIKREAALT
jgi:DNA invertase Pin-like site-specific DNA recombinase